VDGSETDRSHCGGYWRVNRRFRQHRRPPVRFNEEIMKAPNHISLLLTSGMFSLIMMACSGEHPTVPLALSERTAARTQLVVDDKILMCHMSSDVPQLIEIGAPARNAHINHGDYVARFSVDKAVGDLGDGIHFGRIGDAIAAARAERTAQNEQTSAACRITIEVAAGDYRGTVSPTGDPSLEVFPLIIDVPDITLRGALKMQIDEVGRATGEGESGDASTLTPTAPLVSQAQLSWPLIVVNGHPAGFAGNGVVIQGFAFQSGHAGVDDIFGGLAIFSLRVTDMLIEGNRFEGGFSESVDLRATSAQIDHNYLSGGGVTCDLCLAGPGDYSAQGNRLEAGGIPGFLIIPATRIPVVPAVEQWELPAAATVTATIVNNEVRNHLRKPVGVGIRIGAIGVGAPGVAGLSTVEARDNLLVGNNFAMIVEAAFPVANTLRRGDVELTLHGNTFVSSCQNPILVSFSRHTTGLLIPPANAPYMLNSSYTLSLGGDINWGDVWFSHPAGFGNTLTVDGVEIPNGQHTAYDAAKTCAPIP
jgi:hypothetical protein